MVENRVERRLAAILIADVVGYSRLMEADEAGTLAALKERRKVILEPVVKVHGGRIVKFMGDGVLIEFGSAVNAVKAALQMQDRFSKFNESLTDDRRIMLRIGINLGDVVGDGLDIYGEGVNIASRLESTAEPGGICISAKVYDEVRGKIDSGFEDMGEQALKNIATPVRVFRTVFRSSTIPAVARPAVTPDRPSIAVLPFANLGGDDERHYFCDGLTEDIITELSRFRQMRVVSRNSSFRFRGTEVDMIRAGRELGVQYLVEGSVRQIGPRIRITAQLIEAATGSHVWAERYDNAQEELFNVQDHLVRTIVGTLAGRLHAAGAEAARRKPPSSLAAYDYVLRGDALPRGTPEIESESRRYFEKAIALDPGYARAHALLSFALLREWERDMSDSDRLRDEAFTVARRAITLDENDPLCHLAMVWAHFHRGAYESAEQHLAKAVALNPNQPSTLTDRAYFYISLGEPEKAIESLEEAKRLDPFFMPSWYWPDLGAAHFIAQRYDEAIASMRRATTLSTGQQAWLAASYALAGKTELARDCAIDLLRRTPEFSLSKFLAKESLVRSEDQWHLAEGMRKAGLPE